MALDVAAGLAWLHAHRIVHFDVKSQNILLARDGGAKISDVGLARILHRDYVTTLDSTGTFAWAAPELLLGRRCTEKVPYCLSLHSYPPPPLADISNKFDVSNEALCCSLKHFSMIFSGTLIITERNYRFVSKRAQCMVVMLVSECRAIVPRCLYMG